MPESTKIAVIGAGMAGLTCARALVAAGRDVVVFDKARGPGGRMATRRSEHGNFDHGAQFFTARDSGFLAAVETWIAAGVVAQWHPRILGRDSDERRRFVGTPRMSALTRHLSEGLHLESSTRIRTIEKRDKLWLVDVDGGEHGPFDAVAVAVPAPQAVELIRPLAAPTASMIDQEVNMLPCWAVMATFREPLAVDFDAAWFDDGPLDWIAHDATKPGREPGERWVLHAAADWSAEHLEDNPQDVAAALLEEVARVAGVRPVSSAKAHRWRYARVSTPLGASASWDASLGLGLCGDWFIGPRVEAAWLSGRALASMM